MILAAGRGERMRPLTDAMPKSLLQAAGKPLIMWLIESLARAGVRELVINHAYKGEMIERTLGDGSALGVSIAYSPESTALETAGGIARALPLLGVAPFIALAADVYTEFDFSRLTALRLESMAHLVLVPNPAHNSRGDFALQGERVLNEPPPGVPSRTFSGIGVYRPELFKGVSPDAPSKLATLLRPAIATGRVSGELFTGDWRDIGTPERLATLDHDLRSRAARSG
jgi:MurNAc alpha-1-phosphate uridylyltransferase